MQRGFEMKIGPVEIKPAAISNHGSEVMLLWSIAIGVIWLLNSAIERGLVGNGFDVAAFLLVLQGVIASVQKRWEQRGQDAKEMELAKAPSTVGTGDGVQDVNVTNADDEAIPTKPQLTPKGD